MTLYVGDERVDVEAGDFAFGPRDVPHRFDVGPEGARMLSIVTPAWFENLVEAVSVPAQGLTPPLPDVVPPADAAQIVERFGKEILG